MEQLLLPALSCNPCLVAFSGGRDSSAVLATATRVARQHGLDEPVPVTYRYQQHPRTWEVEWQELVVRHLGLKRWERIPITTDWQLFEEVAALGAQLLSLHSWGERSYGTAPAASSAVLKVVAEPTTYPERFGYDAETKVLTFGDGRIEGVPPEVWGFEVSGLKPLQSWLGYRMKKRKGRSSSELDNIRPSTWVFTDELL